MSGFRPRLRAPAGLSFLLVLGVGGMSTPPCPAATIDIPDSVVVREREANGLAAIGAVVCADGRVAWSGAAGDRDLELGTPATSATLFHTGSLSKTVTLAAFLRAAADRGIALDDAVDDHLPFRLRHPGHPEVPITYRMLITHTAGLNDVDQARGRNRMSYLNGHDDRTMGLAGTLQEILCPGGAHYEPDIFGPEPPGLACAYSNLGYALLGLLVEQITGTEFSEYVGTHLFAPLDMPRSTFLLAATDTTDFAWQYVRDDDGASYRRVRPYTWAGYMDGSLRTSPVEYAHFLIMLMNGGSYDGRQVLARASVDSLLALQTLPGEQKSRLGRPAGRALLWNRVIVDDVPLYHFNGYGAGFFTEAFFSPETGVAGAFFTTGQYPSLPAMGGSIERLVKCLIGYGMEHRESGAAPAAPYLGQDPPGRARELFAPGIVSDGLFNGLIYFTAGGREVYFSSGFERPFYLSVMFHSRLREDGWTEPREVPLGRHGVHRPVLAPDGDGIYFISSSLEPAGAAEKPPVRIYRVERTDTGWTSPHRIEFAGGFPHSCGQVSVAAGGNLYFQAGHDMDGDEDIWFARRRGDGYEAPVPLGEAVNGPAHDLHPCIAPDESYLIFDSDRAGGLGNNDLYVSFRDPDGGWLPARNLGPAVNTAADERRASVSFDGRYLFFESTVPDAVDRLPESPMTLDALRAFAASAENGAKDIYWIDAAVIDALRPPR